MPDKESLGQLLAQGFVGTERDYSRHMELMALLGVSSDARVLEFGCSWGYGAWQMARAGHDVKAFEVSAPRCAFARSELSVDAVERFDEIEGEFDVVFSSHVLEHVDRLGTVLENLWNVTKVGGWMIHLIPNGSVEYADSELRNWHQLWGQVHPQLPDSEFWRHWFGSEPFFMSSTPVNTDQLKSWDPEIRFTGPLNTGELLVIVRKRPASI